MNKKLQEIIKNSFFITHEGKYIYTKVRKAPDIGKHFLISKDQDEITVVTKKENLKQLDLIEKNKDAYSLIELRVSIPFYSVGFLAAVSGEIAKEGMDILIVSTYSKDYILVKDKNLNKTVNILKKLGFKQKLAEY